MQGTAMKRNQEVKRVDIFFLSNDDEFPPNNGAILTVATIIKAEMLSAAEAELGALYINAKEAVYIRQILIKLDHPQPKTPIQTENLTAEGVINNKIQPKRTKAMDMRFHWLRDCEAQGQFRIYWRPGKKQHHRLFYKKSLTSTSYKCEDSILYQSQRSSRSKTSATRTKTHSVDKKLNS
jgi:hypothetical protein